MANQKLAIQHMSSGADAQWAAEHVAACFQACSPQDSLAAVVMMDSWYRWLATILQLPHHPRSLTPGILETACRAAASATMRRV